MIELKNIFHAEKNLRGKINKTPLLSFDSINQILGIDVYFKPEIFQKMGSFKVRGIINKLNALTTDQKKRGVVTMSVGNHAISLTSIASQLKILCVIVMPERASKDKIKAVRKLGAKIIFKKRDLWAECIKIQTKYGLVPIHPFADDLIVAGHGTIGLEILRDLPSVNTIFVPVGGGGLISGIAVAVKLKNPRVKIIGVEPIGAPTMFESIRQNRVTRLKKIKTIADGLAASSVAEYTLAYVKKYVDELVLVSDKEILGSLKMILEQGKMLVEPAAAAAFAAVLYKKTRIIPDSKVVCLLSGGNISKEKLFNLFSRKNNVK